MSRVHCTNCGRDGHAKWQCTRPTKSAGRISDASINKDGTPRKNARYLVDCVCQICGKKFEAIPNEVKRGKAKTCSKSCAASMAERPDTSGENNPNWKGGISAGGKTSRYNEKYPEKYAAHRMMTSAIRKGELVRGVCEVCGEIKTDGHHDDYSKPLDVRWLCRKHHIEAHHGRFGALPVDTNNPSSPKGSGVESLRMPMEGRKGRDSTSEGARAKLRDPSAVLTQTAAQPPVGTNSAAMSFGSKSPRLGMDEVSGLEGVKPRQVATPMTGKTNPRKGQGTPEAAGINVGLAHRVERRSPKPKASGSSPETYANAGSSNGRTAPFDGVNAGSTPAPAPKFNKVAYQRIYMAKWRAEIKSGKRVPKRNGE